MDKLTTYKPILVYSKELKTECKLVSLNYERQKVKLKVSTGAYHETKFEYNFSEVTFLGELNFLNSSSK